MNKSEAVHKFVAEDLSDIPTDWVKTVAEAKGAEVYAWPMWGTMWFCNFPGAEELYNKARILFYGPEELQDNLDDYEGDERAKIEKAIKEDDWTVLEQYVNQEMSDARCVLDKDGDTTSIFIFEIEGKYLIGVNAAGFNFYDGVWDRLYDTLGLKWHDV